MELQIKSKVFRLKSKNKIEEVHDLIGDVLTELSAVKSTENWKNCSLNIIEQYIDAVDEIDPSVYSLFTRFDHDDWQDDGFIETKAKHVYEDQ